MSLRTLHTYLGMLIAPTVVFLAFTGLLQIYSLHEAHGDYRPPPLIEELASVHKDQVFRLGHHHDAPSPQADRVRTPSTPKAETPERPKAAVLALKLVFTAVAVALGTSTLIGVWMGLQPALRRRTCVVLLAIGTLVPIALVALSA